MEAGEVGSRQSGITSANNLAERYEQHQQRPYQQQQQQQPPREVLDRQAATMATATLISPTTPYTGHPHSFAPGYPHATAGPSIGGMISPVEPRRPSDDADAPQPRQSLPSISEVISSARSEYPQSAALTTMPPHPTPAPASNFPSPFSTTPRPYPEPPVEKGPSPRPIQPTTSTYPPSQQPLPAFADSPRARQFGGGRPGPPPIVGPYSAPHPSPPMKQDPLRPESDKPPEPHHMNGGYPPSHPPGPMSYQNPGQLPPGQLPLSAGYPVSPRHAGPPLQSPYDAQRTPRSEDENPHARARYDMTVNRHVEAWSYQDCLSRIASGTRTIFNFAEGYSKIAQEQHSARPIPERLPTEREVADMLNNLDYIKRSLESVRDVVQQSVRNELQGKMKGPYEEEDVTMYDSTKPAFGVTEVKKRRGRAAPPGRCHSCNRIDTPEWRRGPDGARTLCNACGLHYAKLERKRQLEARSIRPKGSDEQN